MRPSVRALIGSGIVVLLALSVGVAAAPSTAAAARRTSPSWSEQLYPTACPELSGIDFVDTSYGWAVGGARILATTNGGTKWTAQTAPTGYSFHDVKFADRTHGWATANNPLGGCAIFGTTNGGTTWTKQYSLGTGQIYGEPHFWGLDCTDSTHAWAVVEQGLGDVLVVATTNGSSWTAHDTGATGFYARGIDFVNAKDGWVDTARFSPSYMGIVLATTDGGVTWNQQHLGVGAKPWAIFFLDANHGWAADYEQDLLFRTSNGGASWQHYASPQEFEGLCFTDANHGFAVASNIGGHPGIYRTSDGGQTWVGDYDIPSSIFYGYYAGIDFVDATHGWVAGGLSPTSSYVFSGSILKFYTPPSDTTAPTTTVAGLPAGWKNKPVKLTFTASDNSGGSGVDYTQYKLGSGSWTKGSTVTISTPGTTTVSYRSADKAGNVEKTKTATVKIDTGLPTTTASAATVKANKVVSLKFEVMDPKPTCGQATVTIKIKKGTKTVKTLKVGVVVTNKALTYKYKAKLKKGSYTYSVLATDVAGNKATKIGSATLKVK
jgi:photosystem II stability/assembly factor-like uncharacterized protein